MGWVLGAIGLSQQDGANPQEIAASLGQINTELTEINSKLETMHTDLLDIETELAKMACDNIEHDLIHEIAYIKSLINGPYTSILQGGISRIGISNSIMDAFADDVLNPNNTQFKMDVILSAFSTVLFDTPGGGIMTKCLDPSIIPHPEAGSISDSAYYNVVSSITSYYFGYWVNALLLYNEANNYLAWKYAYNHQLLVDTTTTPDISQICTIANQTVQYYCNLSMNSMQQGYTDIRKMFTHGGAPYTNNTQVIYNDPTEPILWATSIEDFNDDAGVNCGDPMLMGDSKCGPTYGNYDMTLTNTTYNTLSGWEFAGKDDLKNLINPDLAYPFSSIGAYLESVGFKNMTNTSRVVQANETVSVILIDAFDPLVVIPFFFTDWPVIQHGETNSGGPGRKFAVFETDNDFTILLKPDVKYNDAICGYYGTNYQHVRAYHWHYYYPTFAGPNSGYSFLHYNPNRPYAKDEWFTSNAVIQVCPWPWGADSDFYWTDGGYYENDAFMPGWLAYRQDHPNGPSGPAYAFLWPIKRLASTQCTDNRSNTNKGGMPTMCGDDFTAWLINILTPPPPPPPPKAII